MEDYEIRDTMNRNKYPSVDLMFAIVKERYVYRVFKEFVEDTSLISKRKPKPVYNETYEDRYKLHVFFENNGNLYAKYINSIVEIPSSLLRENESYDPYITFNINNTRRDEVGRTNGQPIYGPSWFNPLLPGLSMEVRSFELYWPSYNVQDFLKDKDIRYRVFADNAPCYESIVSLSDIKITQGGTHFINQ